MRVEAHNKLSQPTSFEATRVVVYNDDDVPICVAIQADARQFFVARLGDPEFEALLYQLGIEKTVIVHPYKPPR